MGFTDLRQFDTRAFDSLPSDPNEPPCRIIEHERIEGPATAPPREVLAGTAFGPAGCRGSADVAGGFYCCPQWAGPPKWSDDKLIAGGQGAHARASKRLSDHIRTQKRAVQDRLLRSNVDA